MLMKRILPQHERLHALGVYELAPLLGWPVRKARNFFGGARKPHWVDITHAAAVLKVGIAELVHGMASYTTADWKAQQDEYLTKLSRVHATQGTLPKDVYVRNLANLINGRYNTSAFKRDED